MIAMNKLTALTAWTLGSFAFVKLTSIGPVILTISEKRGWGVHSGDLLVFVPLALMAPKLLERR